MLDLARQWKTIKVCGHCSLIPFLVLKLLHVRFTSFWCVAEIPQINVLGVDAPTLAQLDEDAKAKLAEFRQIVQVRVAN